MWLAAAPTEAKIHPPADPIQFVRSRKKTPLKWHFRQEFHVRLPCLSSRLFTLERAGAMLVVCVALCPLCGRTPLIACGRGVSNGTTAQPMRTECARLIYLGNPRKTGKSRKPCWQCRETVAVWSAIVPRGYVDGVRDLSASSRRR